MTERNRHAKDREEERPSFSWLDVFAFIVAAYQLLLPFVLALAVVVLLFYLLLRLVAG